jgi:hypothetical protein
VTSWRFVVCRLELHEGDSARTIPEYVSKWKDRITCDLFFIDGDHTYPAVNADIQNMQPLANHTTHRVVVDDVNIVGARSAWVEGESSGVLESDEAPFEAFVESAMVVEWGGRWYTISLSSGYNKIIEIGHGRFAYSE